MQRLGLKGEDGDWGTVGHPGIEGKMGHQGVIGIKGVQGPKGEPVSIWSRPFTEPCSSSFFATFNILFIVRGHWGRRVNQAHLGTEDPGDSLDSLDLLDHLELGLQDLKDLKASKEFQDNKEIPEIQVRLNFILSNKYCNPAQFVWEGEVYI